MRKLIGLFKQRWLITLLGVIALALFIWYLGPLFGFAQHQPLADETNRLIAIGILFLIWVLSRAVMFWRAKRRNNVMMAGIAVQANEMPGIDPDEQASQEELAALNEKMEQAIEGLKRARLGGGRHQFLYQLPWYIIIGPPGCGKTTLLRNSDLKFALEDEFGKSAVKGVGGTRNCDWWFTEDAVLLDTAGRYATQDSHEDLDRGGWLGFLGLLKKHRRRRPVNGALVAMSISDLMAQTADERQAHAHAIRKRILELYEQLGVQIPIYVMFTKLDLLQGFTEYFNELNQNDRAQVWGATFDLDASKSNTTEWLDDELSLVEQRLHSQLLQKLEREHNHQRREAIYTFPQQFSALKGTISQFVQQIFDPSKFDQPVLLRGVYFTSATQEGSPIDRIMGSLAANFGVAQQSVAPPPGSGKSFFINQVLSEVIFPESGLVGSDPKVEQRIKLLRYGAFAGIVSLFLLVSGLLINAYINSGRQIEEVQQQALKLQEQIEALPGGKWGPLALLPILEQARSLTSAGDGDILRAGWGFGLSQMDKLDDATSSLYERLLREALLPSVMTRMEQRIKSAGRDTDSLFSALKFYLMLSADYSEFYNGNDLHSWVVSELFGHNAAAISPPQLQALDRHLASLFDSRPAPLPRALDGDLVKSAQRILEQIPMDQRVYADLKKRLMRDDPSPFRISDAAGRSAPLVFTRKSGRPLNDGLHTLYTYRGYHELFLPKSSELSEELVDASWVLGKEHQISTSDDEFEQLRHQVHRRYLDDFVVRWRQLLADVTIQPFSSLEHAVEVLGIVSSDQSPLLQLLDAVARETSLVPADQQITPSGQIGGTWDTVKQRWRDLALSLRINSAEQLTRIDSARVTSVFNDLNKLVQTSGEAPPPITGLIALFNELYLELTSLTQTSSEELIKVKRKQIGQVLNKVENAAKQYPYPLDSMLSAITSDSASLIQGNVCQHIQKVWESTVLNFCRVAIANRYPVVRTQKQEITPEDFGRFFGPNGLVDQFFQQYLAANVDRSQPQWRWVKQNDAEACVSDRSLRQFRRAHNIKNSFFGLDSKTPSVGFSLKPVAMSQDILNLNLTIDGQELTYAHGPVVATQMTWPGPANTGRVRMELLPRIAQRDSNLTFESPWALFRLFDQATLSRGERSEQFLVDFLIGKRSVKFDLRANSALNPFKLNDLYYFRCPEKL